MYIYVFFWWAFNTFPILVLFWTQSSQFNQHNTHKYLFISNYTVKNSWYIRSNYIFWVESNYLFIFIFVKSSTTISLSMCYNCLFLIWNNQSKHAVAILRFKLARYLNTRKTDFKEKIAFWSLKLHRHHKMMLNLST